MRTGSGVFIIVLGVMLLFGCAVDSVTEKADSFGLPSNLVKKAEEMESGNGIKIRNITSEDILDIKSSVDEFNSWFNLKEGTVIKSGNLIISGSSGNNFEYSAGKVSKGLVRVLVYNQTNGILYAIFADGIM